MSNFPRIRKALGPFGFLADILSVAQTQWGVIVSVVIALWTTLSAGAFAIVSNPKVQIGAGVFLCTVWTYIALSILYRLHKGIKTIPIIDYGHAIIVENVGAGYDPTALADTDPAINLVAQVRNVAAGPIQIEVHEFRVVLAGRTIPDSPVLSMVLPRVGPKGITSGSLPKDCVKDKATGTVSVVLHYGPVGKPPERKFRMKADLTLRVINKQPQVGNAITFEEDVPL